MNRILKITVALTAATLLAASAGSAAFAKGGKSSASSQSTNVSVDVGDQNGSGGTSNDSSAKAGKNGSAHAGGEAKLKVQIRPPLRHSRGLHRSPRAVPAHAREVAAALLAATIGIVLLRPGVSPAASFWTRGCCRGAFRERCGLAGDPAAPARTPPSGRGALRVKSAKHYERCAVDALSVFLPGSEVVRNGRRDAIGRGDARAGLVVGIGELVS